ncbi:MULTISPECIES: hypothetical protein [unclassified Meridianimarinicoccus]|uniref:hypothetical protein n=1 Tax=unclassified Meridianimarinicoccus TaxID=2923344 RepID=UPI0018676D0D|nr:hypothetical protein [Fluviibacterium sp. MJW13]
MRFVIFPVLLLLAACGTPEQRCVRQYTGEVATVERLIEETELNLTRGYTYVLEPSPFNFYWGGCTGGWDGFNFCGYSQPQYRRKAVAIDPASENRKLQDLQQKLTQLKSQARPVLEACGVTVVD